MRRRETITTRGSGWALALLFCALLVRAMVPAGWMPVASGNGYSIEFCTGKGAVSMWVDGAGKVHKQKPASREGADQPCAFSGLAHAVALPEVTTPPVPLIAIVAMLGALPIAAVAVGRGLAAPPPPPTGPPITL